MRIALLTYSTKPRGGVVHIFALGEAVARAAAHTWDAAAAHVELYRRGPAGG